MSATVISFGNHFKASSHHDKKTGKVFAEPKLPLDPADFAGRVMFWPEMRLDDTAFDNALHFKGVQTIIDLRDESALGRLRSLHHLRCYSLDRWSIGYFRLGPLISKAERAAKLPFDITHLLVTILREDVSLMTSLSESPSRGAVLVIYPEQTDRIDVFLRACCTLDLSAFETVLVRSEYP